MASLVGKVFGGCELMEIIGRGGMGEVYRAHQKSLDRYVAVKVLPIGMGQDRTFVDRFIQEARSIARLSHPNVVQVFDTGEAEGYYYIIMELISGGTVKDRISKHILASHLEVLDMMEQSARGLGAAHQQGIIHRDIKPGNIMYGPNRLIKVADFGLAKAITEQNELTSAGEIVGTPSYMSPEQCEGRALDHRTDIYSLGATGFHYAVGRAPFDAETPMQIMFKHMNDSPELVNNIRPDIPPGLAHVIDRCLAKDPYDRYQDVDELIMDLHRAADGQVVQRYKPGEGRAKLAVSAEDQTSVLARPEAATAAPIAQTIYEKRELSAREQERRGDAMAQKGQWAFALVAYREALKAFPDSADLKTKARKAQEVVDKEAMQDAVSRVQRLTAEERFDAAYDILARAIKTAGSEELKMRARKALADVQVRQKAARAAARRRVAVGVVLALVLGVAGTFAFLHYKQAVQETAPKPSNEPRGQAPKPVPPDAQPDQQTEIITEIPTDEAPEQPSDEALPDNPFFRALIEAAKKRDQQEGTAPGTTQAPPIAPDVPVEPAAPVYVRVGYSDERLTVTLPDYMRPQASSDDSVVYGGSAPDKALLALTLSRGHTNASPDQIANEAGMNFIDPGKYGGQITSRGTRYVPGVGKCPELRGRYRDKNGQDLAMFTIVIPGGGYMNILTFTVSLDKEDVYFKEYTRLVGSVNIR